MRAPQRRRSDPWAVMELLVLGAVCVALAGVVAMVVLWAPIAAVH